MIRHVIFDIGGVLIRIRREEWMKEDLAFTKEEQDAVYRGMITSPWWKELDRGMDEEEVLSHFCEDDPEHEVLYRRAFDRIGGIVAKTEYAVDWILELKKQKKNVYFLSNYFERLRCQNPECLEFLEYMDGGIWSDQVKMIKPDPKIYQLLMRKYGLDPEECIFLDDTFVNLEGAAKCGIATIHVKDPEEARRELKERFSD